VGWIHLAEAGTCDTAVYLPIL